LSGEHNYFNLIAAITCSSLFEIPFEKAKKAIKSFNYLEHRQEQVTIKNDICFINDSKATNTDSVVAAIKTYDKPTILLVGGYNKNSKFQLLLPHIKTNPIKCVICFGDAAKLIKTALGDAVRSFLCKDLNSAVMKAYKLAVSGDIILLSPGCASFDEFKNFEERGNYFKRLVHNLREYD
jgi:UDP-N-acetylmuramoylalanine--D-glutamate ligase